MEPKIFTVDEAAEYLRLSPGYLRKLIGNKEIKCFRVGENAIRISMDHINEWLKSKEEGNESKGSR